MLGTMKSFTTGSLTTPCDQVGGVLLCSIAPPKNEKILRKPGEFGFNC